MITQALILKVVLTCEINRMFKSYEIILLYKRLSWILKIEFLPPLSGGKKALKKTLHAYRLLVFTSVIVVWLLLSEWKRNYSLILWKHPRSNQVEVWRHLINSNGKSYVDEENREKSAATDRVEKSCWRTIYKRFGRVGPWIRNRRVGENKNDKSVWW